MRYYDVKRHWIKRIEPHLADEELNEVLVRDFNRYTMGRWNQPFTKGQYPEEFESCDWAWEHRRPWPPYWRYVKHAACHWLVNFALRLANLSVPRRTWQIVTSQMHSTVWDGKHTLFDLNFQALGVTSEECWECAISRGKLLRPGEYLKTYFADHGTLVWDERRRQPVRR
jgi:hypothetical protein